VVVNHVVAHIKTEKDTYLAEIGPLTAYKYPD